MNEAPEVVLRSPLLVGAHDRDAWLGIFTDDGVIEDPVGAGAYVGRRRHEKFWGAYIQPNRVTFHPKRDFVSGPTTVRHVTISSFTPVSDEVRLVLPAIIEYRVIDGRISSLRAFWEPRHAVSWHLRQGLRGLWGLTVHGVRMTFLLGPGAGLGFTRALFPSLSPAVGRALAERFARALPDRAAFGALVEGATLTIQRADGVDVHDAASAADAVADLRAAEIEESIVAGDHLACVLRAGSSALVVLARLARGRVVSVRLLRAEPG